MKKTLCSAFLAALTAAALLSGCGTKTTADNSQTSAQENGSVQEIGSELTIGAVSATAHAGDKEVPVNVNIWNNPGYAATGIQLYFDPELKPAVTGEVSPNTSYPFAKCDLGPASEGFMKSCLVGEEAHLIAFGSMATENNQQDGTMFTVYFDIPENAPAGKEYIFTCEMDSLNNAGKEHLTAKTVTGTLKIE